MEERLVNIIKKVMESINTNADIENIDENTSLRTDLGFDSMALAELTVRIEAEFGVDVFEDGIVDTIGQIEEKLKK